MRNSANNTRRITALTLAVALGVAVYLNWEYAKTGSTAYGLTAASGDAVETAASGDAAEAAAAADSAVQTSALPDAQAAAAPDSGEAVVVSDGLLTEQDALEAADKNYGEAQLVSVSKDSGAAFFDEARLSRSKTRDSAVDEIEQSLKNASLSKSEKEALSSKLQQCLEDITAENEIETLVKAKGMADCLCFLQDGKADLTVMTSGDGLNASQVAQIRDIVLHKCPSLTAQSITIVEVK